MTAAAESAPGPGAAGAPLSDPVVVIGAGPAGLTAAYQLVKAGDPVGGGRGRRPGRRDQPDRRAGRLALRHRRPPLLHQGEAGRGPLARDPAGRGLPAPAAQEPHLLQGQVLRLPARPTNALRNLGPKEAILCGLSYLRARSARRRTRPTTRAGWSPGSAGACTARSSRPTPRRCGACRSPRCRPTGPPSG